MLPAIMMKNDSLLAGRIAVAIGIVVIALYLRDILPGAGSSDLIFRALRQWLTRKSHALISAPIRRMAPVAARWAFQLTKSVVQA